MLKFTRDSSLLIEDTVELKLVSPHLKRAAVRTNSLKLKLTIESKKLYYLNLHGEMTEAHYNISNIRFFEFTGLKFHMWNSTCKVGSVPKFRCHSAIERKFRNVTLLVEKQLTFTFRCIEKFKDEIKYLHCVANRLTLVRVLNSVSTTELIVTDLCLLNKEPETLEDELHELLLKIINNGSLVKNHLPWTCLCQSDCQLKTI